MAYALALPRAPRRLQPPASSACGTILPAPGRKITEKKMRTAPAGLADGRKTASQPLRLQGGVKEPAGPRQIAREALLFLGLEVKEP